MAIITQDGLFYGDRVKKLSLMAQLYWPRFFVASNTCGRIELNFEKLTATAFASLPVKPTMEEFWGYVGEYYTAHLLFTYDSEGQIWGQWDTDPALLPRHKLRSDERTPEPPKDAWDSWIEQYKKQKHDNRPKVFDVTCFVLPAKNCAKLPKESEILQKVSRGVGVGGGVGKGRQGEAKPSRASASDPRHTPVKEFVKKCCEHAKVPFTWEGGEASALNSFLKGNPDMTEEQVVGLVRARFRSKDPPGDRPRIWIGNLGRYATENSNHGGISKQDERTQKSREAITRVLGPLAGRDRAVPQDGSNGSDDKGLAGGPNKLLTGGDP